MASRAELGSRAMFPSLVPTVYVNHAAISPLSEPVVAAVNGALADVAREGVGAYGPWAERREVLRAHVAAFFGVSSESIGFPPGTTRGISDLALALPLKRGQRVVCFEGEFPSNVMPWRVAASRAGASVEMLPLDGFGDGSGAGLSRLEGVLKREDVAAVAVSAVQFQTGLAMPLAAMSELCHQHDALLMVDGIQAAGVVPLKLAELGVDAFVAGTHKWLMGIDGLALVHASERAMAQFDPATGGWLSTEHAMDFLFHGSGLLRYDHPWKTEMSWMEGGVQTTGTFAALEASLGLIEQVGVEAIYAHVQRYHDALEPKLQSLGFASLRASDGACRSGSLSVRPRAGETVAEVAARLAAGGVSASTPDGCVRFAPHWPNALSEVEQIVAALS